MPMLAKPIDATSDAVTVASRRPTVVPAPSAASPELSDRPRRRTFGALVPLKRGPKTAAPNPLAAELAAVQRDNNRLARRLARAEAIIDVQKKLRSCWASRWRPATASLDTGCRRARTEQPHDGVGLCRAGGLARHRAAPTRQSCRTSGGPPSAGSARQG